LPSVVAVALAIVGCRSTGDMPMDTLGAVGASCMADTDCRLGLTCIPTAAIAPSLGSVCTRHCTYESDCPTGSRCGPSDIAFDASGNSSFVFTCVPRCDRRADISTQCLDAAPDVACGYDGVCSFLRCGCDPGVQCDARTGDCITGTRPAAHVEDGCTTDADCRPPRGECIRGHCAEHDCDRGGSYACIAGETCVGSSMSATADVLSFDCARTCTVGVDALGPTAGGACANGQTCMPHESDPGGMTTTGYCAWLNDFAFTVGRPSAHVGDACTRNDDCPSPYGYGVCVDDRCALRNCATSAFSGAPDPCGPNERCVTAMYPGASTREITTELRTGLCVQSCSGAGTCPTGMVCVMGGNYCQADCRIDASVCIGNTHCATDGTCT
jgi:hypothetical protein